MTDQAWEPNPKSTVSDTRLWLVPTELERERLQVAWRASGDDRPPTWRLCGFGPVAAGILTTRLLAEHQSCGVAVREVVLVGIGGSYDLTRADLGAVVEIGSIATDTVGAERSSAATGSWSSDGCDTVLHSVSLPERIGLGQWLLPSELGFPQVGPLGSGEETAIETRRDDPIFESLVLPGLTGAKLLTVGIASGSEATAAGRRAKFPGVLVEDMEGFAVALACRQFGVGCRIWRGISNAVGDRRMGGWRIDDALGGIVARIRNCFEPADWQ